MSMNLILSILWPSVPLIILAALLWTILKPQSGK